MPASKTKRTLVLSQPVVIATLAIAFALTAATSLLTALSTRGLDGADERAAHAQQTVALGGRLLASALGDAAGAARSFAFTGAEPQRAAYAATRQRAMADFETLRQQFAGRDQELVIFAPLQQLLTATFADFDHAMAVRATHGVLPALEILESHASRQRADEMRRLITALQQDEFSALAERSAAAAARAQLVQAFNLGLISVALALAVAAAWFLIRRVRDLEGLITVCAWTRRVQWQGRWVSFEEYLAKRFNLRCTHGICDEAAAKMKTEAVNSPVVTELREGRARVVRSGPAAV